MPKERCLILGGCGFIGSHLADSLLSSGHEVRLFDQQNVDTRNVEDILPRIELHRGDFTNTADIAAAVRNVSCIFHLVGTTLPSRSNENPLYDLESNVGGTLNLLDAAVDAGVRKVIFSSSGGTIYGVSELLPTPESAPTQPLCAYGVSKLAIEKYLALYHHLHGLDYGCLRIANPYGERQNPLAAQGAVAVFLGRAQRGEPIHIWGDGEVTRDYIYVEDVIRAFDRVMHAGTTERVFNVGSGRGVSLNQLLQVIQQVTGVPLDVRYQPGRKLDVPVSVLDIDRMHQVFDWTPQVDLTSGIAKTWRWIQAHHTDQADRR